MVASMKLALTKNFAARESNLAITRGMYLQGDTISKCRGSEALLITHH
jgi:hypothetical protein